MIHVPHFIRDFAKKMTHFIYLNVSFYSSSIILYELARKKKTLNKLEKPLQFNLTRSAIYGRMMSEYTICNILNAERNHYYSYKNQLNKTWAKDGMTHNYSSLRGKKMAVLGSGEIGNEISRMFKQGFEIRTVAALVKNERQASENGNVENYYTNLNKLLEEHGQELDYLVSVLPSTKHTKNLLSESVFSQLKNCLFVNIGRGDICTEESIIEALDKKYLRHAVLDVVPIEPLPVDSKLWTHPNVIVTPHVSGKDNNEDICRLFLDNLDLYLRGDKLKYLVNVEQEY